MAKKKAQHVGGVEQGGTPSPPENWPVDHKYDIELVPEITSKTIPIHEKHHKAMSSAGKGIHSQVTADEYD